MTQHMYDQVIEHIKSLTSPIVIGVSGGIDSMVLLALALRAKSASDIIVVHIDHAIRPESHLDAEFLRASCKGLGVECEVIRVDVPNLATSKKISLEAAGREARYACFERVRACH